MLISRRILEDYLDLSHVEPSQLTDILTQLGHEVEAVQEIPPFPETIVIGEVLEVKPHPNADRLHVCQVNTGSQTLGIVCGAPNVRPDLKVAVALVGCELEPGFTIKATKIRGVASTGMLCSERELGVSDEHSGIMELDSNSPVGQPLANSFDRQDWIYDLSITPNRGDCLSHQGIARELAAKLKLQLKRSSDLDSPPPPSPLSSPSIGVRISDTGCGRLHALLVRGVECRPSPPWLKLRLKNLGFQTRNLMVDVGNYVMAELGQPVHIYDFAALAGGRLELRAATSGDRLESLDGQNLDLKPGDLLICDAEKPVALAGIMGGENSKVNSSCRDVLIEAAHFDSRQIRRTAKRLGLHTEASQRFERGIDIEAIPEVAQRVAALISANGGKTAEALDRYPTPSSPRRIALRIPRVKRLLGLNVSLERCTQELTALGLELLDQTSERLLFSIPSFRHDLQKEVDLIEEVGRLLGYDEIPYAVPKMDLVGLTEHPLIDFSRELRHRVAHLGFCELRSFPFQSANDSKKLGLPVPNIELENPLNAEQNYLQASLAVTLLNALQHNRKQGVKNCRLFELGRCYGGSAPLPYLNPRAAKEGRPGESLKLGMLLDDSAADFTQAKDLLLRLGRGFGMTLNLRPYEDAVSELLHPGAAAEVLCGDQVLGYLGEVHPRQVRDYLDGGNVPIVAEIDVATWYACLPQNLKVPLPSRYPALLRDLAFLLPEALTYAQLETAILNFPKRKFLQTLQLFDVYRDPSLPANTKSMALSLSFGHRERTLTDKEVDAEVKKLLSYLQRDLGVQLRAG